MGIGKFRIDCERLFGGFPRLAVSIGGVEIRMVAELDESIRQASVAAGVERIMLDRTSE